MLFRKKRTTESLPPSYLGYLVIAIVIATIGLRLYQWIKPETTRPLLTQAEGLVEVQTREEIAKYTQTPTIIPTKLFGSSLFTIGIYPNETSPFPKNSVAMVLTRDDARFVEIDYLPNTTLDGQKQKYASLPTQTIKIDEQTQGLFIRLRNSASCVDQTPSFCQFTRVLLFEKNGTLIKLFADGNRVSDGELIEMARSMN